MEVIKKIKIEEALNISEKAGRVYLAGELERAQKNFKEVVTDGYEIGISKYSEFTCEKAHVHTKNREYNYVITGSVKVYFFDTKEEHIFSAGDFYVIDKDEPYMGKAQPGTKVIFSKDPGGDDKVYRPDLEESIPEGWQDGWDDPKSREEKPKAHSSKGFFGYLWQAIKMNKSFLIEFSSFVLAIVGLISMSVSFRTIMAVLAIGVVIIIIKVAHTYITKLAREVTDIPITRESHVYIMKNDFYINFDKIIHEKNEIPVMAIGIDSTMNLELSTASGILKHLMDYMEREGVLSQFELQAAIDEAYQKQFGVNRLDDSTGRELLDVLIVKDIPIIVRDKSYPEQNPQQKKLTFLFIANSRKRDPNGDIEDIETPNHQNVIIKIFEEFDKMENGPNSLMMGAIGTNGGQSSYPIILTEIINCFSASIHKNGKFVNRDLYLSIRLEDIKRQRLEQSEMVALIKDRAKYVK